jgi:Flp pilus assembly protein TadB
MTTTRFPSRDGLLTGLLYLVLGFVAVYGLTLTGLPPVMASLTAIILAAVVVFLRLSTLTRRPSAAEGTGAAEDAGVVEDEQKEAA